MKEARIRSSGTDDRVASVVEAYNGLGIEDPSLYEATRTLRALSCVRSHPSLWNRVVRERRPHAQQDQ